MKKIFLTTLVTLLCSVSSFAGEGWLSFNNLPIGDATYKLDTFTIGQISQGDSVTFSGSYSSDLECQVSIEFFRTNGWGALDPNYGGGHISPQVMSEVLPATGEDNGTFEFGYRFSDTVAINTQNDYDEFIAYCLHCKLLPTDGSGEFGYSNNSAAHTFIIVEKGTSSGITTTEYKDFALYPNPTMGVMNVAASFSQANARVYDITGRMVKQLTIQDNQVNVSDLKRGNYLMQIEGYSPISFIKL